MSSHTLCYGLPEEDYSTGLHTAGIFVVLVASILGCGLPILTTYVPILGRNPFIFVVAKTSATGVLLSVSTIHLLQDAIDNFNEPCIPTNFQESYQAYAFLFALCAALLMLMIDYQLAEIAEGWMLRKNAKADNADEEGEEAACGSGCADNCSDTKSEKKMTDCKDENAAAAANGNVVLMPVDGVQHEEAAACPCEPTSAEEGSTEKVHLPGCGHSHDIVVPDDMSQLRRIISAACMEFGVTLHSLFVGLDIGLTTDSALKPLLIALVFHQLFEGMSLGSRMVDAKFKLGLEVVLALAFSVSAPMGMAAATIAVSVSREAMKGGAFVMMMAVLNSLCAGMLMYLAFNLLFSDFTAEMKMYCKRGEKNRTLRKVIMFAALWIGMLIMALIGKWA